MYQDFYNKNDDYVNQFKQKVAEQKIATIEERRHEMARSRNNFLGTLAGVALAGVVAWFVLAPQYKQAHKNIPTIHRPETAVKVKPENPGGMNIPNQDKGIYNLVEKKDVDNTVVENLLPTPEQPKLPDIVPEVTDTNADNIDEIVNEVSDENLEVADNSVPDKPQDLLEEGKKTAEDTVQKVEEKVQETTEKVDAKAEEVKAKTEEKAKEVKETAKEAAKAPEKTVEKVAEKVAEKTGNVANGKWQVQLVASSNKAAVEKAWTDASSKYGSVLNGLPHEVQTVDLGTKGTMYRLRAGSFATKDDAQKVCSALKAKGMNDCIAKER